MAGGWGRAAGGAGEDWGEGGLVVENDALCVADLWPSSVLQVLLCSVQCAVCTNLSHGHAPFEYGPCRLKTSSISLTPNPKPKTLNPRHEP
jgi:hypothetical protein